jgi:hypothetical protein
MSMAIFESASARSRLPQKPNHQAKRSGAEQTSLRGAHGLASEPYGHAHCERQRAIKMAYFLNLLPRSFAGETGYWRASGCATCTTEPRQRSDVACWVGETR